MTEPVERKAVELSEEETKQVAGGQTSPTAIEYGLIASTIAVAIIGAVNTVGQNLANKFNAIGTKLK